MSWPLPVAQRSAPPATNRVRDAKRATWWVFTVQGCAVATWSSRIPQVRARLDLGAAGLGLALAAVAAGGLLALALSGLVVTRVGSARAIRGAALLMAAGLGLMAVGYLLGLPWLAVGLIAFGFATGLWDVAMNVHAAALEQRIGRAILPRFHAGFSLGTVAGATVGVVMVVRHVPVDVHLLGTALLVASSVPLAASRFLSDDADLPPTVGALTGPPVTIWWERRTLTIGVVAAAFAMAEGAGNNWISVSVTARHGATATTGGLAYTAFLGSVTVGRWCGPPMLDRWGRVAVLRSAAGTAVAGLFLFVLGSVQAAVLAGIVLWGLGASLGFPVSMSAGADQPAHAASRVGVIATVGYCGFLGGPPLIGLLGDQVGVTSALLVVAAPLVIAARFARATRPLPNHLASATPPGSVRRRPHRPRSPSRRQPC